MVGDHRGGYGCSPKNIAALQTFAKEPLDTQLDWGSVLLTEEMKVRLFGKSGIKRALHDNMKHHPNGEEQWKI